MKRLLALLLLLTLSAPAFGMETTLTARANSMQLASSTRYFPLMGAASALTDVTYSYTWISAAGTFGTFSFRVTTAPGSGLDNDFVIYRNGSPEISFSISGTATTATPAGTISASAGDYIYVGSTSDAGAATSDVFYTCTFTGTTAGESLITGGGGAGAASTSATNYSGCMGLAALGASAINLQQCMPTGGTISYLYCSDNIVLSSGSFAVTLYVNGSPTALTATLGTGGTTGNDTAHSVAVSAGDLVQMATIPSSPNATRRIQWGMKWTPTTDGEAVILGGSGSDPSAVTNEFNFINNGVGNWTNTEASWTVDWPAVELRYLAVELESAPGTDNQIAFTVRDDGAGTALDATIVNTDTYARDTTHSVTPSAGSAICIGSAPTSTPTVGNTWWGVVAYIAPAATSRRVMVIQ